MHLLESGQMYLETIFVLSKKNTVVRSVDISEHMGFSKPSVSRAVGLLKEGGYITANADGHLFLTDIGLEVAEKIYDRHTMLTQFLIGLGVDPQVASDDACKIEHDISDESFDAIKRHAEQHKR